MNFFSDALSCGLSGLRSVAAETITYQMGALEIEIEAVAESKDEQDADLGGSRIRSVTRTQAWLIEASQITDASDNVVRPEQRHRLQRADGTWYRVQNPQGDPVWEWTDGQRTCLRVMTVEE